MIEDAAHASGSEYGGRRIGAGHGLAAAFSFYAIKNMTTGEGGMVTTNDDSLAQRIRLLALHGMSRDAWNRYSDTGSWYYEVTEAGFKYNMTDIQAGLGMHQLRRLDDFIARRQEIAAQYDRAFARFPELRLPNRLPGRNHTYHLYPIQIRRDMLTLDRSAFINELRARNIGTSVHFIPLYRHPVYRDRFGYREEQFPMAERIYEGLLSLPLYPKMTNQDAADVIAAVEDIVTSHRIPMAKGSAR